MCRSKIRRVFKKCRGQNFGFLLLKLNEELRRILAVQKDFMQTKDYKELDFYIFQKCRFFLKRLHPKKSWGWIETRYFLKDVSAFQRKEILQDPVDKTVLISLKKEYALKSRRRKSDV